MGGSYPAWMCISTGGVENTTKGNFELPRKKSNKIKPFITLLSSCLHHTAQNFKKMKIQLVGLAFLMLLAISCKHKPIEEPAAVLSCEEAFIQSHQLLPYNGQELGCKGYYALYELEGKSYFSADNPCADMISNPVDCDGQPYAPSLDSPQLAYFYSHATYVRIVGIAP